MSEWPWASRVDLSFVAGAWVEEVAGGWALAPDDEPALCFGFAACLAGAPARCPDDDDFEPPPPPISAAMAPPARMPMIAAATRTGTHGLRRLVARGAARGRGRGGGGAATAAVGAVGAGIASASRPRAPPRAP